MNQRNISIEYVAFMKGQAATANFMLCTLQPSYISGAVAWTGMHRYSVILKNIIFFDDSVDLYLYNFCILYKQMTLFTTDCMVVKTLTTSFPTQLTFSKGVLTKTIKNIKCSVVKVVKPRVKSEDMGSLWGVSMPFRGQLRSGIFFSLSPPHQIQ